jgi:hypothetical protein
VKRYFVSVSLDGPARWLVLDRGDPAEPKRGPADPANVAAVVLADFDDPRPAIDYCKTLNGSDEFVRREAAARVRPDGPETDRGGLIGQHPY